MNRLKGIHLKKIPSEFTVYLNGNLTKGKQHFLSFLKELLMALN